MRNDDRIEPQSRIARCGVVGCLLSLAICCGRRLVSGLRYRRRQSVEFNGGDAATRRRFHKGVIPTDRPSFFESSGRYAAEAKHHSNDLLLGRGVRSPSPYTTQLTPILCFVKLSKALDGRDGRAKPILRWPHSVPTLGPFDAVSANSLC